MSNLLISRTYAVETNKVHETMRDRLVNFREAFTSALTDLTWWWRRAYAPLDNRRRLRSYEERAATHPGPLPPRHATAATLYAVGRPWPPEAFWRRPR